ncbi:MAG: transposase, partial [Cyanobacteria bacterium J06642_2]
IAKLDNELKFNEKSDPNESTYRSAPGIRRISARVLFNELGDMSQFKNEPQLFSFTGLTPSEYSTGNNVRRGHITRQGNTRVRAILVEAAWRAIGKDESLARFFEKLYHHTGKKKAIVAVGRKLIGRIQAAFQHGEKYRIGIP